VVGTLQVVPTSPAVSRTPPLRNRCITARWTRCSFCQCRQAKHQNTTHSPNTESHGRALPQVELAEALVHAPTRLSPHGPCHVCSVSQFCSQSAMARSSSWRSKPRQRLGRRYGIEPVRCPIRRGQRDAVTTGVAIVALAGWPA
jgi:hypothetical protein